MPTVTSSIVIETGPERLWEMMGDPAGYPDHVVVADRMIEVPDGELGLGSTYREYGGIKPFKGESTWTVTTFDPMTRQVHTGTDAAMNFELTTELVPVDGGTRLTQTLVLTPKWFARPLNTAMWPLFLGKRAQAAMNQTLANVKAHAEKS
jgi:hypothetical protein